jgi:hypothetical protein
MAVAGPGLAVANLGAVPLLLAKWWANLYRHLVG